MMYFTFPKLIFLINICNPNRTKLRPRVLLKDVANVQRMKCKPYTRGTLGLIKYSRIVALIIHQLLKELKDLQHKLSEKYIKITQKLETTDRNNHSNDWFSASLKLLTRDFKGRA